jgi:hypothetical protein
MQTIQLRSRVGADGVLHLQVPVSVTNTDVEVIVIVQPQAAGAKQPTPTELDWPPGFFEETAGAWQGEPLVRPPQGEYEVREELG